MEYEIAILFTRAAFVGFVGSVHCSMYIAMGEIYKGGEIPSTISIITL